MLCCSLNGVIYLFHHLHPLPRDEHHSLCYVSNTYVNVYVHRFLEHFVEPDAVRSDAGKEQECEVLEAKDELLGVVGRSLRTKKEVVLVAFSYSSFS